MNPNREELLFQLALEKPADKLAAFLDAVREGDTALRQRLEALLAAHEESQGLLAEPAPAAKGTMEIEFTDVPDETVGQKIRRYKILEKRLLLPAVRELVKTSRTAVMSFRPLTK